jgi:hypothetical protein
MRSLGKRLLALWQRWDRHINLAALAIGFAFDLWIAKRPDSIADNLLLLSYLVISAAVIVILNIRTLRRQLERERPTDILLMIIVLQFCFGGLANNMLVLYGKSGTLGASLLFVGVLAAFGIGNEFLKERYDQLRFNVAIYYFLLLTYCIIAVPTFLLHDIGAEVFLASAALSIALISFFLFVLSSLVFRRRERKQLYQVGGIVASICTVMVGLYFLNVIPPVPLSLKDIGVYHSLTRLPVQSDNALYVASYERSAWYVFWRDTSSVYTFASGESAYCFSAVFAPGKLSTPIVHRWEKYDPQSKDWVVEALVTFPINGGRAGGYRGWSAQTLSEGQWRCEVETEGGQLIGRLSFSAIEGTAMNLSTTTL